MHWYRLPAALRARVWAAYRPGQERDLRPSPEYLAAAREVQAWIQNHLKAEAARNAQGKLFALVVLLVLAGLAACGARRPPCIDLDPTPEEVTRPEALPRANPCTESVLMRVAEVLG